MAVINIMVTDDHQMFIDGLESLLKSNPEFKILPSATSWTLLKMELQRNIPNVLLLDISMPEMNGIDIVHKLKITHPEIKIILLSMFDDPYHIREGISAGVNGYILKETSKEELFNAIKTVHDGGSFYSQSVTETLIKGMQTVNRKEVKLSEREKQVLQLLTEENTTQEIAKILKLSPYTIETHRKNLLSKLDVRNTTGLVKYALNVGLAKLD